MVSRVSAVLCLVCVSGWTTPSQGKASLELHDADPPGVGLSDPAPRASAPQNPGTTLGELRQNVLLEAARQWGERLESDVTIHVDLSFAPLACADQVILGSAGATMVFRDFPGAPRAGTWYPSALADSLARVDLEASTADIVAQFNASVDGDDCLPGVSFYYGLDHQPPPGTLDLLAVALHELAHGLGMANFVNESSGAFISGMPDVYSHHVLDTVLGQHWPALSEQQRQTSATNTRRVVWTGERVTFAARAALVPTTPALGLEPSLPGFSGVVDSASFGPDLDAMPVRAELALAQPMDACSPVAPLDGNIALVARGGCSFVYKAQNVQAAGGAALLVHNLEQFSPPGGMTGQGDVRIPALRLTARDGELLREALSSGTVVAKLAAQSAPRGADADAHLMIHTPNPVEPGSSGSHWAPLAERPASAGSATDLLMEPALSHGVHSLDIVTAALADQGWRLVEPEARDAGVAEGGAPSTAPQGSAEDSGARPPAPQAPGAKDGGVELPADEPTSPFNGDAGAPAPPEEASPPLPNEPTAPMEEGESDDSATPENGPPPAADAGFDAPAGAAALDSGEPPDAPEPRLEPGTDAASLLDASAEKDRTPEDGAGASAAGGEAEVQPQGGAEPSYDDHAFPSDVVFRRSPAPAPPTAAGCSVSPAQSSTPTPLSWLPWLALLATRRRRSPTR